MAEQSFEEMLNASMKPVHAGEVVDGKVIEVSPSQAILGVGAKYDGILESRDYDRADTDLTTVLHVGDTLKVKVTRIDSKEGVIGLSYKQALAEKANETIQKAFEEGTVLKAKVTEITKGGVCADVDGARVFIPASLLSDTFVRDLSQYQDQEIEFVITEYDPRRRRIIGNRKQIVAAQHEAAKQALLAKIQPGDVFEGTVRNTADFGAFIDIGGVDGLLHVSEMSWGHAGNPKKEFKAGDKVRVFVKAINGEKISLSRKFPDENPWIFAEDKYAIGTEVTGRVARMTDFGAFIELEPGVDGLLHVSQISREHIDKPSDVLQVGQEVQVVVLSVDAQAQKISLSMKELEKKEDSEKESE